MPDALVLAVGASAIDIGWIGIGMSMSMSMNMSMSMSISSVLSCGSGPTPIMNF
jgi:uncharacterized protein with beta-barrel porin domain